MRRIRNQWTSAPNSIKSTLLARYKKKISKERKKRKIIRSGAFTDEFEPAILTGNLACLENNDEARETRRRWRRHASLSMHKHRFLFPTWLNEKFTGTRSPRPCSPVCPSIRPSGPSVRSIRWTNFRLANSTRRRTYVRASDRHSTNFTASCSQPPGSSPALRSRERARISGRQWRNIPHSRARVILGSSWWPYRPHSSELTCPARQDSPTERDTRSEIIIRQDTDSRCTLQCPQD